MKKRIRFLAWVAVTALAFSLFGCGEEYYSTPDKTLKRYVDNRMMVDRYQYESCLNAFRKEDREWYEANYIHICRAVYGKDCPGEGLPTQTTVWTDLFEPAGPTTHEVAESEIDEDAGTAVLVVEGQEIEFVKQRGNWKIKGFFGVPEDVVSKHPKLAEFLQ